MARLLAYFILLLAPLGSATAIAAVERFSIINQTGAALSGLSLRRVGSDEWMPLAVAPAAGASVSVTFKHPDCAFDLRGTVAGSGSATWRGINLCDVKSVTLNRDSSGRTWVDYD
jgi:hypothetical protein